MSLEYDPLDNGQDGSLNATSNSACKKGTGAVNENIHYLPLPFLAKIINTSCRVEQKTG